MHIEEYVVSNVLNPHDIMHLLTAVGKPPGSSSTIHIYTRTIQSTTQNKQYIKQQKIHKTTQKKYIEQHKN
jgi:hypothetical protein